MGPEVCGSRADDHQNRHGFDAIGEVGDEPQRRRVSPLEVVDREHQRRHRGKVDGQPVETVKCGLGLEAYARRLRRGQFHQRTGESCRAREQLVPLVFGDRLDKRLVELPGNAERELGFELAAARSGDGKTSLSGELDCRGDEARLADAGRPFDQGDRAGTRAHLPEQLADRRELRPAFEQLSEPARDKAFSHRAVRGRDYRRVRSAPPREGPRRAASSTGPRKHKG